MKNIYIYFLIVCIYIQWMGPEGVWKLMCRLRKYAPHHLNINSHLNAKLTAKYQTSYLFVNTHKLSLARKHKNFSLFLLRGVPDCCN